MSLVVGLFILVSIVDISATTYCQSANIASRTCLAECLENKCNDWDCNVYNTSLLQNCTQQCYDRSCANLSCHGNMTCTQFCDKCTSMRCNSAKCQQDCEGTCHKLMCDFAQSCSQKCTSCNYLSCRNNEECKQTCLNNNCSLTCFNTTYCLQNCYSEACSTSCFQSNSCNQKCNSNLSCSQWFVRNPARVFRRVRRTRNADNCLVLDNIVNRKVKSNNL